MPDGGAWKELFKASEDGNLEVVEYHLSRGIDPNWQHPEYFTAPIFEAIRNGRSDVVRSLVERGGADPALIEDFTDLSPLEVALEERRHDLVDYLITKSTDEEVAACVRTFVVTTTATAVDDLHRRRREESVMRRVLSSGHRLVVVSRDDDEDAETDERDVARRTSSLKRDTGNSKIEWRRTMRRRRSSGSSDDVVLSSPPHVWIRFDDDDDDEFGADAEETSQGLESAAREIVVSTRARTSTNESNEKEDRVVTIVEPDLARRYNRWTQSWWLPTLTDTVWWAATTMEWDDVKGGSYDHRRNLL